MKPLVDFPGYYINESGDVFNEQGEKRPVYISGKPEYKYVSLPDARNKRGWQLKRVHILIAKTYIPNPDNLPMVDHIDRNRMNNSLDNLRWVTKSENQRNTKSSVVVTWQGEEFRLPDLIDKLYGVQKPHYAYVWTRLDRGDSIEEAVRKNNERRQKLGQNPTPPL